MPKVPVLTSRRLIRALHKLGFVKFHQVGSHAQFKHADGRRVTVAIHTKKEIKRRTLKGILTDIDMSVEEIVKLLRT